MLRIGSSITTNPLLQWSERNKKSRASSFLIKLVSAFERRFPLVYSLSVALHVTGKNK